MLAYQGFLKYLRFISRDFISYCNSQKNSNDGCSDNNLTQEKVDDSE